MKNTDENRTSPTGASIDGGCVFTTGEYFADGTAIEPVRGESDAIALLYWDGHRTSIAPQVKHRNRIYQPAGLDQTIAHALRVPPRERTLWNFEAAD